MCCKLPSCAKRLKGDMFPMCGAIGIERVGDLPCECEGCLKAHGGKCPLGKEVVEDGTGEA